jgi:hypothetical protein
MADENKPPQSLTEEQLNAWMNENLGKTVNNMLTARLGTFEKKITSTMTEALGKSLEEKLSVLRPAPREEEPEGKEGDKDKDKGKTKGEMASLKAELTALRQRQEETERERQALLLRQREMTLRSETSRILGGAGIVGDRFEAAYALLVQTGRIKASDDPNVLEGVYSDIAAGGDIPLEQGLQQWLKTETAKIFLPANGPRGSGSGPTRGLAPSGKQMTDGDRRSILAQRMLDDLGK